MDPIPKGEARQSLLSAAAKRLLPDEDHGGFAGGTDGGHRRRKGWNRDATERLKVKVPYVVHGRGCGAEEGTHPVHLPLTGTHIGGGEDEPQTTGDSNRAPATGTTGGEAEQSGRKDPIKLTLWLEDSGHIAFEKVKELFRMYFDPHVVNLGAEARQDIQSYQDLAKGMIAEVEPAMEVNDGDNELRKAVVTKWDEVFAKCEGKLLEPEAVLTRMAEQQKREQAQQDSVYVPDDAAKKMKAAEQHRRKILDDVPESMKKGPLKAAGSEAGPKAEDKPKAQPKDKPKVRESGDGHQWELNIEEVEAEKVVI